MTATKILASQSHSIKLYNAKILKYCQFADIYIYVYIYIYIVFLDGKRYNDIIATQRHGFY